MSASANHKQSEPSSHEIEEHKSYIEYLRHLTTLSTGSILLLTAFLDKVFDQPKWKTMIVISFIGFTMSIIASVLLQTLLIPHFPGRKYKPEYSVFPAAMVTLFFVWFGFLSGILSLTIFAVRNLYL